ncbi:hypothetical protein FAZ19_07295 [Sphingobacterium alkalisoli]|uniref:Uncharacterized protein n=1 Tax=Sphingobacterium alkalisoli TaxID=1874115 RepID=A0A4U0H555_9SPHI|nr:hypothetical protein [Sphingobacterium alkalisoli]TJY66716.1 hypothetical protein FAZ19_07295 [Sphingobacterium alkalisoli]GGH14646.1 hypothetical protein GCM10011418_15730 [Sphingobacterium alkalisoli]
MKFERFIKQIDVNYKEKISAANLPKKVLDKLDLTLSKDITTVRGLDFYHIVASVSQDFENHTVNAFEEYVKKKKAKDDAEATDIDNKYKAFIKQFIVLQQDVAKGAKIQDIRLSRILNREIPDFLAWEVYAIAVSREVSIKSAFEELYKD